MKMSLREGRKTQSGQCLHACMWDIQLYQLYLQLYSVQL